MIPVKEILSKYDKDNITIGVLGGHSALDVCRGAKKYGFKTLAVCQKGREKTYAKYYKTTSVKGCVDEVIILDKFSDITNDDVIKKLQEKNVIFIHNRYFWVYFDFQDIKDKFHVPIYGTRDMVERTVTHGKLSAASEPEEYFFEKLFSDDVVAALDDLPHDFKMVVLLVDINEFSYTQVATILSIPVGTVMSRLHRGRRLLRSVLYTFAVEEGYIKPKNEAIDQPADLASFRERKRKI